MKLTTILFTIVFMTTTAHAELVCAVADAGAFGQTAVTLKIDETTKTATVQSGGTVNTIAIDHSEWDGHIAGLMTGKGFSFMFENHFGCIRNAELTAKIPNGFGRVNFSGCTGGSTPDNICF